MRCKDLFSTIKSIGEVGTTDLVIVVPLYKEYELAKKHIELLEKQTFCNFDLLLVPGPLSPVKELLNSISENKKPFGIIVAVRKNDSGSAGGFFSGQVFAVENKYKYIILADADCLPIDPKLVNKLYASRINDMVAPRVMFIDKNGKESKISESERQARTSTSFYNLFSIKIFEKYGLYYAPLYQGYEDAEFINRIKIPRTFIEAFCTHPSDPLAYFTNFGKSLAYMANQILFSPILGFLSGIFINSVLLGFGFFFIPHGQDIVKTFFSLIFHGVYGKGAFESFNYLTDVWKIENMESQIKDKLRDYKEYEVVPNKWKELLRKDIVISEDAKLRLKEFLILAILSKSLTIKQNNSVIHLVNNGNAIVHFMRLFGLFIASAFSFMVIIPGIGLLGPRLLNFLPEVNLVSYVSSNFWSLLFFQ
ncbi:glycosyltransferase family 2 protein, partial [Candidatus Micrarchaeota archaeon]|nr:glycosyltransferase family 2 protein [Candidatus Micrarchaeota archaeon]